MSDMFDHEGDAWALLDGREDEWYHARPTHCSRCGAVCYWHHTGKRWALTKDGELHNCNVVQPGEFEDLTKAQP